MVDSIRTMDKDIEPVRGVPLELAPLLTPFRGHKRLTVRIERLPHKARLSGGHNNGDGTWSLTRDDLEGLSYMPPAGLTGSHTLAIRIISFDADAATTLAQIDLPVSMESGDTDSEDAEEDSATNGKIDNNVVALSASLTKGRKKARAKLAESDLPEEAWIDLGTEETAGLKSAADKKPTDISAELAAYEKRVSELALQLEKAKVEADVSREAHVREIESLKKRQEAAAAEAAAKFAEDFDQRLKDARGEWEETRAKWEAEQALTRQKIAEAKAGKSKQAVEAAVAKAREDWEAELHGRLAEAAAEAEKALEKSRAAWQQERKALLADVESKAKGQLDAAQAGWRAEADRALAEAKQAWKEQEAARLAEAERKLAEVQEAWKAGEAALRAEASRALAESKEAWKAEEAARLAEAETHWQAQSKRDLAEVTARYKKAEAALVEAHKESLSKPDADKDGELRRLRDTLAATQADLSDRENALAESRKEIAQLKKEKKKEVSTHAVEADLASARKAWARELEDRLAEVTAEAEANLSKARAAWQTEMDDRLAEAEALKRESVDKAQKRGRQEIDAALTEEKEAWKAEEAVRLADAEAAWRKKSAQALTDATARYEKAEAALADALTSSGPQGEAVYTRDPDDIAELRRLRDEVASIKASLSERDGELAQAQAEVEQMRERLDTEIEAAIREAHDGWKALEGKRIWAARIQWRKEAQSAQARAAITKVTALRSRWPAPRYFIRGGIVVACLVVAAIVYFAYGRDAVDTLGPKVGQVTSEVTGAADKLKSQVGGN